jgi:2-polyprenyl-6-methoxyphenol hydroxylase-like FAD-dependent oxidoreductase
LEHAIVIGGSIAGLATASILSRYFSQVTIVDGDSFPAGPVDRTGVPQGFHQHVLLAAGRQVMDEIFDGMDAQLEQMGAETVAWGKEVRIFAPSGRVPGFPGEIVTRPCSRALLEYVVRNRVRSHANVRWIEGTKVMGLSKSQSGRVANVHTRCRQTGSEQILKADFIVDASGRSSALPRWLEILGYSPPAETVVNPFLGYATRWYARIPSKVTGWKAIEMSTRAPDVPRAVGLWPVEGERWIVTLAGTSRDYPPTDEAGFLRFSRNLIDPLVYNTIQQAVPISDIKGYRRTENRWRHYERLRHWPRGVVALGDAVCCFNPIYGQGMTSAVLQARLLGRLLQSSVERGARATDDTIDIAARKFRKRVPSIVKPAWLLATSEDYRWPATQGPRPGPMLKLGHLYTDWMLDAAANHGEIVQAFLKVSHMLKSSTSLARPSIAARVLRNAFSRRFGGRLKRSTTCLGVR